MVELYQSGDLKLDELITTTYTLDQVNEGYEDLIDGKNIRGVIRYDTAPLEDAPGCRSAVAGPDHGTARRRPRLAPPDRKATVTARGPPVIGLRREREVLTVALRTNRHVVLEGPPGTGKSTLLRSIAADVGQDVVFVEGNAELTPARLIGQYDPAAVLADGLRARQLHRRAAAHRDARLRAALPRGAQPDPGGDAQRPHHRAHRGRDHRAPARARRGAAAGFRLIAAMNPFDAIGTARVGQAIADRMCRVVLGYQDAAAERAIVAAVTGAEPAPIGLAVRLVRATREHRDLRMGSSVRGAIDLVLLLDGLLRLRGGCRA